MAKKTSGNAVKKIEDQIKKLESNSTNNQPVKKTSSTRKSSSSTAKKTTTKKSGTRDKVVVAPAKKTTTTTKKTTTTSKNVRGGVVAPAKKKKTTTKTITNEKIKNELQGLKTKKEKVEVVASREKKKQLESEVNKILEIEDSYNVKDIELPKFIQEDKPEVEELKEDLQTRVKEFLETEDEKEKQNASEVVPVEPSDLDKVDVIKFSDKKPTKKGNLKKKPKNDEDIKLEKPIDLDQIDQIEEFKIVEEFEKDIPKTTPVEKAKPVPKKQEFTRKRKGKGYVVTKKPTYHELESDLRSLYDKVGDVVGDFDETGKVPATTPVEKKTPKKFTLFPKKKIEPKKVEPKKIVPKKTVPVTPIPKKKKVVVEEPVELEYGERPSLLDHISQKVLNFFLIILFIIFGLMSIAFIGFVIYVSTF